MVLKNQYNWTKKEVGIRILVSPFNKNKEKQEIIQRLNKINWKYRNSLLWKTWLLFKD